MSLFCLWLLAALAVPSLAAQDQIIADFESGRFDGWTMTGNCWGSGPENARFAGRLFSGWQGVYFLSSAHPRAPGLDPGSGTGRALSPTFRITGDTIRFLIGGGRQYGRCGIRLLVEGQETLSETGDSPFRMRPVVWDVREYHDKVAQIEVFDNAATGTYAYVHVDDIVMTRPEPEEKAADRIEKPAMPLPLAQPVATTSGSKRIPSPRKPLSLSPFPMELGPPPPIAPYTTEMLPTETVVVPMIFPLLGGVPIHNNYNDDRGPHRHTGIDMQAHKMWPIVAPFSGTLGFKVYTFWIYGDNGYKCLGTHLNDDTPGTNDNTAQRDFMFAPNIRPGDHVIAGQFIGYVGNSGDATGPHLHFELFTPDGIRSPLPSLTAAQRIKTPRLNLSPMPPAPNAGEVCIIGCPRDYEPTRRVLTVQLVARQKSPGSMVPCTTPKRYYLVLTPEQLVAAGGIEGINALPRDRTIIFYGTETKPGLSTTVRQMLLSP